MVAGLSELSSDVSPSTPSFRAALVRAASSSGVSLATRPAAGAAPGRAAVGDTSSPACTIGISNRLRASGILASRASLACVATRARCSSMATLACNPLAISSALAAARLAAVVRAAAPVVSPIAGNTSPMSRVIGASVKGLVYWPIGILLAIGRSPR